MGGLAEGLMATTAMAYLAAGAKTIGAAFAAAAEALPFAAFFAQVSAFVGVVAGAATLGVYLRELSGLTDKDLFEPHGQAAVAHGESQIAFWGSVADGIEAGAAVTKTETERLIDIPKRILEPILDPMSGRNQGVGWGWTW